MAEVAHLHQLGLKTVYRVPGPLGRAGIVVRRSFEPGPAGINRP